MCEVTRHNFTDLYAKIEQSINSADFIAIDTEFTGLYFDTVCKPSLFDNSGERYFKLRKSVQNFSLLQLGITTFVRNAKENRYIAETFNFHLCPMSFGSHDQRFYMQASSVQFLCKHKFNFNMWLYEGLPYLNKVEEKELEEQLENGLLFSGIESELDEKELQNLCSGVAAWVSTASVGECLTLQIDESSFSAMYICHKDLRTRFPQIWTSTNAFGQLVVERVDHVRRILLEKQSKESESQQRHLHITEMLGFTRVFRMLQRARKPIVGHNLLMDLMFMYEKFHHPLPDNYRVFKEDIHALFPTIFDTKHINHCLRKPLKSLEIFKTGNLHELYEVLHCERIMGLMLQQPTIVLANAELNAGVGRAAHHAGYDSYVCGCVFLRLCHLLHFRNFDSVDMAPCSFKMYLSSMKDYCNCINVIRAMVNYINLAGTEPPVQRPPLIHVQAIKSGTKLIQQQLALWFSLYGAVDVQMVNSRQAIVATANFITAQDIISAFKDHDVIRVTKYRFWEHSILGQSVLLCSLAVATGSCIAILMNVFR
ncbi:hypothetical protein BsWGS_02821 [Bradybaena similaris]